MIIYGSEVSKKRRALLKDEITSYIDKGYRKPCLAVILVGDDPASHVYVNGKKKACASVGMDSRVIEYPRDITMDELLTTIQSLNKDETVDGILVQLPLPKHLSEKDVVNAIDPTKDVDGLHPMNVGKLYLNENGFVPCTPSGIMVLLEEMGCSIEGKNAVVMGRSQLVGAPVARLLQNKNATVTICHSKTKDIRKITKQADILVVAIGQMEMVDSTYIKEGAYVIDVGMHRKEDGHLCGDVAFDDVVSHTTAITPVPKGVGPMTICMLLENTMKAYKEHEGI